MALKARIRRLAGLRDVPVRWAACPPLGRVIARALPLRHRPLLILSMPRSGSSWVGEIAGAAANAMYLREPITQTLQAEYTVVPIDPRRPPANHVAIGDLAFAGNAGFPGQILPDPSQWRLRGRSSRRVVVKEVNPMAAAWMIERYRPRVVFLLRHPAAIAASYWSLGWRSIERQTAKIPAGMLESFGGDASAAARSASGFWGHHGVLQAVAMRLGIGALASYPDHYTVRYEDICAAPEAEFRRLFEFAGLQWDETISARINERSSQTANEDTRAFSTVRNSASMVDTWRRKVAPDDLRQLEVIYRRFDLPYYDTDADWHPDPAAAAE